MKYGRPAAAYALAVLAVAGTALLRWLLGHWLDESAPLLLFVLPIALSACLGGLGPGLLATALSVVAGSMLVTASVRRSLSRLSDHVRNWPIQPTA